MTHRSARGIIATTRFPATSWPGRSSIVHLSGPAAKHLFPVPVDELRVGPLPAPLRAAKRLAVTIEELAKGRALAVHLVRDDQPKAAARSPQTDGAAVKGAMVEDAQGETVADFVGPAR